MWNEKKNQIGDWMINNIFEINKINKSDILIKHDEKYNKYCFILIKLDTCNGISRKNNSIIQLSFMFLGTKYIYSTYSKPDDSIDWSTGNKYFKPIITKDIVKKSPNLKYVLLSFLNIISKIDNIEPIFVAHNASFYKSIIQSCFSFYKIKFKYNKWCNTMNKEFFNIRDNEGKLVKSLKKISEKLLNDNNIVLYDSKDKLSVLYKCLLKNHYCDNEISIIIFKTIKIKVQNHIFNNCKINNTNIIELLNEYYYVIEKEKEILNYKNVIENKFKNILKNKDYIIVDNKKIMFKEIYFKDFIEENIKEKNIKRLYITNIN